ncbi:MAG: YggS family pyridoxal phosphate-dependent enzyme [Actinomycetota bacterium]|nr:YggS family pyridoxal phosphate-dependent enzyme [Actinomycetota bacterium]
MAELIRGLRARRLRANLDGVRGQVAAAAERVGRDPAGVEICAATKYVAVDEMGVLADAGVATVGENRAQDLEAKVAVYGERFTWHFIGRLQSRKVRHILPHVRLIHSLSSESALAQLERHREQARPGLEVLIEVDVAGEPGKAGVRPDELEDFLARCPVPVTGLMTMPPLVGDPEQSRPHFGRLRALAAEHGLARLSMGTTQDYAVAVEEGATIIRIGSVLYA